MLSNVLVLRYPVLVGYIMFFALVIKIVGVALLMGFSGFKKFSLFNIIYIGLFLIPSVMFVGVLSSFGSYKFDSFLFSYGWYINLIGYPIIFILFIVYILSKKDIKSFFSFKLMYVSLEALGAVLGYYLVHHWISVGQYIWVQLLSTIVMLILMLELYKEKKLVSR